MALELWPEFTGGSYYRNPGYTDSERLVNFYCETSGKGENNRSRMRLQTTPGLTTLYDFQTFNANITGPVYDLVTATQVSGSGIPRTYALIGGTGGLFLVEYRGTSSPVVVGAGPIIDNPYSTPYNLYPQPRVINCGQDQLLIINGLPRGGATKSGAVFNMTSTVVTPFTFSYPGWLGASDIDFLDGYAIASEPNTQTFYISAIQDARTYDPLDIAVENDAPDTIVGLRVVHRDLFVFGKSRVLVWNDSGAAGFPFSRNNSATIEIGCISPATIQKLNDTLFWLGRDQRGGIQAWRMNGYNAQRISTPAIESLWQNYYTNPNSSEDSSFAAVNCYSYQEEGHQFYVVNFSLTAIDGNGFSWVYDDSEGLWHERQRMNPVGGLVYGGCGLPRCHTFSPSYGHIVGSRLSAKIYLQSRDIGTEDTQTILRQRTTPHLYQGSVRNYYKRMVLDIDPAVSSPTAVSMGYTHNGWDTKTAQLFPTITDRGAGRRVAWNRLGSGLDFGVNVLASSTVPFSIAAAYLELQAGAN